MTDAPMFMIAKEGIATLTEFQTRLSFRDEQKILAYMAMSGAIEREVTKVLMPKEGE